MQHLELGFCRGLCPSEGLHEGVLPGLECLGGLVVASCPAAQSLGDTRGFLRRRTAVPQEGVSCHCRAHCEGCIVLQAVQMVMPKEAQPKEGTKHPKELGIVCPEQCLDCTQEGALLEGVKNLHQRPTAEGNLPWAWPSLVHQGSRGDLDGWSGVVVVV